MTTIHDPYLFEVAEKVTEIHRDLKALREIQPIHHLVPRFNKLYGTLRAEDGWRFTTDNWSNGTIATSLTAPVLVDIDMNQQSGIARTSQWPGGVQFYLAIRFFGIAPQTAQAGNLECVYFDDSGYAVPLGEFLANAGGNENYDHVIPSAIADPGNIAAGTLSVTLNGGVTTAPVCNWMFGWSYAYLLPSRHGYDLFPEEAWKHE
jgi:hypothetical protein